MQTAADTNNANTIGDCARLLVAARLPLLTPAEDGGEPPPLSFEALLAMIRQRPLLAAADCLFAGFVAMAEVRHGAVSQQLKRDTRTLLSVCPADRGTPGHHL
jgi:hypothetical protein